MRKAVIGIGSNSVRMLQADIAGAVGVRLRRDREGTRLFAGLDADGCLREEAMRTTLHAVAGMASAAREAGCGEIVLFATSATRDAKNAADFALRLREAADLELRVLSGEEEAALSFFGASGSGRCGVMDIGGGSTEVIIGEGEEAEMAVSCQMGAVRLSRLFPIACEADLAPVISRSKAILLETLGDALPAAVPDTWYGTGGTFTTLAALINGVPWTDRTRMHGTCLPLSRIRAEALQLAPLSLAERRALPGLQPNRADIIVHGISILIACMETLKVDSITVSEYGNLDGFMKHHYHLTELI